MEIDPSVAASRSMFPLQSFRDLHSFPQRQPPDSPMDFSHSYIHSHRPLPHLPHSHAHIHKEMNVEQWQKLMKHAHIDKSLLSELVLNWLTVSGYQEVAETFQQEAGVRASVPLSSISARTAVRQAIVRGEIDSALSQLSSLCPTLLEEDPKLALQLRMQKLVELIRQNAVEDAIEYARNELRQACADDPVALTQLESIMVLLAFSSLPAASNPLAHLLAPSARVQLAAQVNDRILEAQFSSKDSHISRMIKSIDYAQTKIQQFLPHFPAIETRVKPAPSAMDESNGKNGDGKDQSSSSSSSQQQSDDTNSRYRQLHDPVEFFESRAATEARVRRTAAELQGEAERIAMVNLRARRYGQLRGHAHAHRMHTPYSDDDDEEEEEEEDDPEEEEDPEEEGEGEEDYDEEEEDDEDDPSMSSPA